MGGMFGGRPQTQSSTTVQAPQLPAYLEPYMTNAASNAQTLYNSGQLATPYYPGSTVAPQSQATSQGYNATLNLANNGQPSALQQAADQQQLGTIQGNELYAENNPYLQSAMNAANNATIQQFQNATAPSLLSNFSRSGRLSSSAVGNAYGQAANQLSNTLSNSNANMAYQNYNNAANRQQQAAQYAPQLAAGDYTNAQQLQKAGTLQDAYNQDITNANIDRYNYNQNLPQSSLQNYINLLNGTAGSVGNGSTSSSASYGDTTRTAQTLGTAATLASMFFSDRRLKDDIQPIGKLKNGLIVYRFRYKGQAIPVAGVMADEVERIMPQAVSMKDGYKMVNYGML